MPKNWIHGRFIDDEYWFFCGGSSYRSYRPKRHEIISTHISAHPSNIHNRSKQLVRKTPKCQDRPDHIDADDIDQPCQDTDGSESDAPATVKKDEKAKAKAGQKPKAKNKKKKKKRSGPETEQEKQKRLEQEKKKAEAEKKKEIERERKAKEKKELKDKQADARKARVQSIDLPHLKKTYYTTSQPF